MSEFKNKITRGIGSAKLSIDKHSPEIALASSIIFGALSLGFAIKSTLKAQDVLDEHKERMDKIHEATEIADPDEYTEIDVRKDTFASYAKTGFEFTKLYAPTIIFGAASVACSITGHKILSKRNLALAATAAALKKEWDEYRSRVVRDLGSDMDRHFLYDTVEKTIEKTTIDDKGKEKVVKEKISVPTCGSVYSRIFDESNKFWVKDGSANYLKVRSQLLDFNRKIVEEGYGFLNFGYRKLGFPITIVGQQAGWVYDPKNPEGSLCQLKGFGTVKVSRTGNVYLDDSNESDSVRAFRQGYERNCLFEFGNLRESIYEDIKMIDSSITEV